MSTPDNALPARQGADTEQVSKAGHARDSLKNIRPFKGHRITPQAPNLVNEQRP
jgi:hypothetical protein